MTAADTRGDRLRDIVRVLWVVMALNLVVAAAKFLYGQATGSLSMRNDGIASAFDALSNVVGIVGASLAAQPPDRGHPYGHAKFETYASVAIGVMLVVAAFNLCADGVDALMGRRDAVTVNVGSYVVMVGTLVVNLAVSRGERLSGRRLKSEVLVADALHTRSDALVSVSVIVGLVVVQMGFPMADAVVSLLVGAAIAVSAVEVFRSASTTLSDAARLDEGEVRSCISEVPGVRSVHNIRTRGTEGEVFVDLHVLVDPLMSVQEGHGVGEAVEARLRDHFGEVSEVIVHIEPDTALERRLGEADDAALGAAAAGGQAAGAGDTPSADGAGRPASRRFR
ncbi:cation diffusion facilitator family transporter [Caniella muris]|uniref:cation diffusion facilitator family transporter n=1 Tax=Caniella muris TaxID=2941502 RepID=UPI00203AACBA|nr:cation diffusion facilitator family transporter [Caniella muris]